LLVKRLNEKFQTCEELKGFQAIRSYLSTTQGTKLGQGFEALSQEKLLGQDEEDIRRKENAISLGFLRSKWK